MLSRIRWAAEEIGSTGLGTCGLYATKDRTPELVRYPGGVYDGKLRATGVNRCGTTYCPVCGPAKAAKRAAALDPQVAALMAAGWTAWLATFTLQHQHGDDRRELVGQLIKAWANMTKRARWTRFAKKGAGCRWVRGVDLTDGGPNGCHPHIHAIVLLPPGTDGDATLRWVFDQWCKETRAFGREARLQGFDAFQVMSAAGVTEALAYATSGGSKTKAKGNASASVGAAVTASEILEGGSVVIEAVGAAVKSGRGQGRTMADLARDFARGDDNQAIRLWQQCVLAIKGREIVTHSAGLSFEMAEEGDAPVIERETVAELAKPAPKRLDRHWHRLVPAADQSVEAVRDVLRDTIGDAGVLWDLPAEERQDEPELDLLPAPAVPNVPLSAKGELRRDQDPSPDDPRRAPRGGRAYPERRAPRAREADPGDAPRRAGLA